MDGRNLESRKIDDDVDRFKGFMKSYHVLNHLLIKKDTGNER